jgi:hypothetical protein
MFTHRGNTMLGNSNLRPFLAQNSNHNENMNVASSAKQFNSNTTTPSSKLGGASVKRRAFGDISNKKSNISNGKSNSSSSNVIIKKNTAFTPARSLKFQPLQQQSKQQKSTSAFVPKSSNKRAIVPRKLNTATITAPVIARAVVFEAVDDVELPAGRLFCQEPDNSDDELTQLSEDEFNRNMWYDWRSSMQQKYNDEHDENIDKEVQERMQNIFDQGKGPFFAALSSFSLPPCTNFFHNNCLHSR